MKNKIKRIGIGLAAAIILILAHSCTALKEYDKAKLNDAEMALGNRTIEKTELNFQSYREGSSELIPEK